MDDKQIRQTIGELGRVARDRDAVGRDAILRVAGGLIYRLDADEIESAIGLGIAQGLADYDGPDDDARRAAHCVARAKWQIVKDAQAKAGIPDAATGSDDDWHTEPEAPADQSPDYIAETREQADRCRAALAVILAGGGELADAAHAVAAGRTPAELAQATGMGYHTARRRMQEVRERVARDVAGPTLRPSLEFPK